MELGINTGKSNLAQHFIVLLCGSAFLAFYFAYNTLQNLTTQLFEQLVISKLSLRAMGGLGFIYWLLYISCIVLVVCYVLLWLSVWELERA